MTEKNINNGVKTIRKYNYSVPFNKTSLSEKQYKQLQMLFIEANWIVDDIINFYDNNDAALLYNTSVKNVIVNDTINKTFEIKEIKHLNKSTILHIYDYVINLLAANELDVYDIKKYLPMIFEYDTSYKLINTATSTVLCIDGIDDVIVLDNQIDFMHLTDMSYGKARLNRVPVDRWSMSNPPGIEEYKFSIEIIFYCD